MRIFTSTFAAAALALAATAATAAPGAPMQIKLTGADKGDPAATGTASVTVDAAAGQVCYKVATSITNATMAHIHKAPAGASGPVVVPFANLKEGKTEGCATAAKPVAEDLLANPADYYVNVHSPAFPAGAVRGQLK
jgi:hypothetical protein